MIKVQTFPNEKIREFHLKTQISFTDCNRHTSIKFLKSDKNELGEVGVKIGERLFNILGVDSISISKYSICVSLTYAFDWSGDIEKDIKDTIQFTIDELKISR